MLVSRRRYLSMDNTGSQVNLLNDFFNAFKIKASCKSYYVLGSVQCYNVFLDAGEKYKKIEKVSDEMALWLKHGSKPTLSMSLEDGIVKIEFKNLNRKFTNLNNNEIIKHKNNKINCLLGEDIYGAPVLMDIESNPHLIIAGCTGSGKSAALHTIIANVMVNSNANMYLIDPKRTEFGLYQNNKRCKIGYSYDDAIRMINYLHDVMISNFSYLNFGVTANQLTPTVLIIDEFADLIFQDQNKQLYTKLCTLAQKCRAARIYIVIATQRPSAKIVDGNIKANFPARLAFKTSSKIDSKIILDQPGAESLMGKGDAILKLQDGKSIRLQLALTEPRKMCYNGN